MMKNLSPALSLVLLFSTPFNLLANEEQSTITNNQSERLYIPAPIYTISCTPFPECGDEMNSFSSLNPHWDEQSESTPTKE